MICPHSLIILSLLQLSSGIWAFPQSAQHESRDLLDVLGLVNGLLGSIASLVDPDDRRPDAAHPYQAPGLTDQRGPCPGMNILANHGYLPRSGIISAEQAIQASVEVFNMGVDIATILTALSLTTSGNIVTGMFSIGGEDNRTYSASGLGSKAAGRQWGLDAHSRVEVDVSVTRADFFLNNGDNHSGIGSRFARFTQLAAAHDGQYAVEAANELYGQNARISLANNPRLFQTSYNILATLAIYPFVPYMFSNGTYGAGGVANYESISSILGFQLDKSTGKFCYVPERFPDNWYRRSVPYLLTDFVKNLGPTFLSGPLSAPNPLGAVLTNPNQLPQLECAVYQAMFSVVPTALAGESVERIAAALSYVQTALLPLIPATLGCPININGTDGDVTLHTQDSLQETGPGGGQAYNVCSA